MDMNSSPAPTRKRTHLRLSQIATLQESFDTNPLPDSSVRSRLARELAVTERTIQIWFQNRRAKARKIESIAAFSNMNANTIKPGWVEHDRHLTPPRYQATFRTMMTPKRFEELKDGHQITKRRPRSSSKPEKSSHLLAISSAANRAMSEGIHCHNTSNALLPALATSIPTVSNSSNSSLNTPIQMVPLPINVLRIGSWTRFAYTSSQTQQHEPDLVCYGSPLDREFIWRVQADGHHFRIQISFDHIRQLHLSQHIQVETGEIIGQLKLEINLPLTFSMWRFGQDHQWIRCGDFTEDKQASIHGLHILQGDHEVFRQTLLDLMALAPELASKINIIPAGVGEMMFNMHQAPPLDVCRDFTISPSTTPEPGNLLQQATTLAAVQQHQRQQHQQLQTAAANISFQSAAPYGMIHPRQLTKGNMSHLMLQAPFFHSSTAHAAHDSNNSASSEDDHLYQMMLLQQNALYNQTHQQQQNSVASSTSDTPSSSLF